MSEDVRPMEEVLAAEEPGFARALEAVLTADTSTLSQLLADEPELARQRSAAHHESTLLHYVAANGVETALQVSPGTIYQFLVSCSDVERTSAVERAMNVPKLLIDAGAEVDALCRTYGGGPHQTTLNLLVSSAHPHNAGVQETLARVLVQSGAAVDGLEDDQSPLLTALAFGYWRTVAALVGLGARCDGLIPAAASGELELVEGYFPAGALKDDVGTTSLPWFEVAKDPGVVAQQALVYASLCGHERVVRFLLERGVDVDAIPPGSHVTAGALHTAALAGHCSVVECLLEGGADPTKREPRYGGDPQSWAEHGGDEAIVERLREASSDR
ncbi:MAG: ankyrin repeat domain-containing protein [Acidobacteriota bacterium]